MLQELKDRTKRIRPDLPTDLVLDCLVQDWQGPGTRYSPKAIHGRIDAPAEKIFSSFTLLQGEPLHVLEGQWVFTEGERELPISEETLMRTLQAGAFKHPERGELVPDFMQMIHLVYEAGKTLNELLTYGHSTLI